MSNPEPTIIELVDLAGKAISGSYDKTADFVRGSDYEALNGPTAIVWTRETARDTDLFNAVNFSTADGEDLTVMAEQRFGIPRILDTRGQGTVSLRRNAGGIGETIWKGTRISILGSQPKTYRVTDDVPVASTTVDITVPIEALDTGRGVAADVDNSGNSFKLRIDDQLEDSAWFAANLHCDDGLNFEPAEVFRARVRKERSDARVGQTQAIIQACKNAGASNVALFRSDYAGDAYDSGLNVCYVGDLGYTASPELVKACTLALRKVRVGGDHLQVLPMVRTTLDVIADVYLTSFPALFDLKRLDRLHGAAILQYLNGASGRFVFSMDGLRSAIARHTPEVHRVIFDSPTSDGTVVLGALKNFPEALNRYVAGKITLRYRGP